MVNIFFRRLPYSGTLEGEISRFCGYSRRFSLRNLGAWDLWRGKSEQSAKVFSAKIAIRESVLSRKQKKILVSEPDHG